jgi:hypothetical protein
LQGCRAPAPFHNGRRALAGLDPATDHQPPVRRRQLISPPTIPIRSWACSTFPSHHAARAIPRELPPGCFWLRDCEVLSLREFVAALQRVDGADAWLFPAHFEGEPGTLPV